MARVIVKMALTKVADVKKHCVTSTRATVKTFVTMSLMQEDTNALVAREENWTENGWLMAIALTSCHVLNGESAHRSAHQKCLRLPEELKIGQERKNSNAPATQATIWHQIASHVKAKAALNQCWSIA